MAENITIPYKPDTDTPKPKEEVTTVEKSALKTLKKDVTSYTRPFVIPERFRNDTTISSFILYNANKKYSDTGKKTDYDYVNQHVKQVITPIDTNVVPEQSVPVLSLGSPSKVNSGDADNYFGVFNNVMITDISESYSTIQKLHLNFSNSWNVFFFNNNPITVNISGHFLDTQLYPYYQEFMMAYEKYLCATEIVGKEMRLILTYDGKILDGYILNVSVSTSASYEVLKSFNMQFLVRKISWIRMNHVRHDTDPHFIISDDSDHLNALGNKGRIRMETGYASTDEYLEAHKPKVVEPTSLPKTYYGMVFAPPALTPSVPPINVSVTPPNTLIF